MIRHKNSYYYHKIVLVKNTTWLHNVKKKNPKHVKTLRACKKTKWCHFFEYTVCYIHVEK